MAIKTTDLCDDHADELRVLAPIFGDYGGRHGFSGPIQTVKTFEDNSRVREVLETPGEGQVLVVDGSGSLRCALMGDQLAARARDNGWAGLLVYGCVRDAADLANLDIGIKALNTHPCRSQPDGEGEVGVVVTLAGATLTPGEWLCADRDGIVIADTALA
ncbi:ribonuclease E activity regulator RraA [Spiribacter vilamensis]|uniref:4-hydroxy-4-methyl-2-oxoglutarate aldolase n=1 Tax=Spiribacter vilamensis TaxID=531306 RepID=A0A4Q8CYL9_9GAMM|nr:ribonuclease E activity regulator RraA [Spiribacter vilamensis]RZU98078.1 regulator of ribonuclease activity A [Spiribacter vilamensis]TVO61020.1 RraA family protein [Spiribacter vilamensis]